jgi:hypothetical protein
MALPIMHRIAREATEIPIRRFCGTGYGFFLKSSEEDLSAAGPAPVDR